MKPTAPRKKAATKRATKGALTRYTLERVDQVRLLAHPLRLRLFEAFAMAPRTTHQVARALGLAPTRLYHHVNALEKVGLLQLKETRQVRGATEKYYQSISRMLDVEPSLFAHKPAKGRAGATSGRSRKGIEAVVSQLLEGALGDLTAALGARAETPKGLKPIAARLVVYGTPEELQALRARVAAWIAECSQLDHKKKAGATRKPSRATLTLFFTAGPEARSDPD